MNDYVDDVFTLSLQNKKQKDRSKLRFLLMIKLMFCMLGRILNLKTIDHLSHHYIDLFFIIICIKMVYAVVFIQYLLYSDYQIEMKCSMH